MVKRLWIFNHDASSPSTGPMLRHYNFAKFLHGYDIDTTIFASNRIHSTSKEIPISDGDFVRQSEDGEDFIRIKTRAYSGNGLDRILNWVSYFRRLFPTAKKLIKNGDKPDVIIGSSVHPLACLAAIRLAKKYDCPAIVEVRDLWPEALFEFGQVKENSIFGKLLLKGEYWLYKNADAIIFTKEGDSDHIKEMGWSREQGGKIDLDSCHYINNGVDLELFDKQIEDNKLIDLDLLNVNDFKIVYTGSLRPMNNIDLILDAAKLLMSNNRIQFLIYGDGNLRKKLEERLIEENINNVKIKGFVEKKYIPYILSNSNLNLLNYSNNYGWKRGNSSNKMFEYMASGVPILSTVKMGYDLIEKYQCGISLEDTNAHSLAKAIEAVEKMDSDSYNRIARNSREAAKDFDFNILTDKLVNIIKNL